MKTILLLILMFATTAGAGEEGAGVTEGSVRNEMRKLLEDLPRQAVLSRSANLVKNPKSAKDESALKYAREKVKLAQERVPKIRALIKVGASIFEYPGLLAAGKVDYIITAKREDGTFEMGYQLYLGVFLADEFSQPWDFHVVFDEKGIVTAIKSVDWRH